MVNFLTLQAERLGLMTPDAQAVTAAVVIGTAILGLVYCFFGYRSVRIIAAIVGFFIGLAAGSLLLQRITLSYPLDIIVPLGAGLLFAILCAALYKMGIFIAVFYVAMSVTGTALLEYVHLDQNVSLIIALAAGLVFAILSVIFHRAMIIIATAFLGSMMFADQIFEYLIQVRWDAQVAVLVHLATALGLGLIGMIFQFVTTRKK